MRAEPKCIECVQFFDNDMKPIGEPRPFSEMGKIPDNAVCYKKFMIFVCEHEALGRKFQLKSDKLWAPNFVYFGATYEVGINDLENQCHTVTQFAIYREIISKEGLRLVKNRLGRVSLVYSDDVVIKSNLEDKK